MDIPNPQQTVSGIAGGGEVSLYQYFVSSPLFAGFVDLANNDRKIFMSQYATLPSSLKNYLASTETSETIVSTSLEFNLDDNQTSAIASSLRELITGKIFIKDFPTTVSSKLGIDDIKAGEIVNKIVSTSFGPIIEDVKRIQRSSFPDKIMAMQKESQPTGLSPKPQISEEVKNMPLNRPDVQSVRPPSIPSPAQQTKSEPVANLPAQPSPPPPAPPRPDRAAQPVQTRPPLQMAPRPSGQSTPSVSEPKLSPRPEIGASAPQEKQFKIPDLGQLPMNDDQQKPPQSQKSLEEELEKVANVIDLRAKSEE